MKNQEKIIEEIVKKVFTQINDEDNMKIENSRIFPTMKEAIDAAFEGQKKLVKRSMADRRKFVECIKKELIKDENIKTISSLGAEETGMGNYEDKIIKNKLAV